MSHFLTADLARQAADLVRPAITALLGSELVGGRRNLHLVIGVPDDEGVLYGESFGDDPSTWKYPFNEIAISKLRICQRTGMVTRTVQRDAPWLYQPGDTRWVGGVIENELAVAASGLPVHFDEMISWMVLDAIQALCRDKMENIPTDAPEFFE